MGSLCAVAWQHENGAAQVCEKLCSRLRRVGAKLTRSPPGRRRLPAWRFDGRPALAGNSDAERKVWAIRAKAECRIGVVLKESARSTPAEFPSAGGNAKSGKEIARATGGISSHAHALSEHNISS
jgi:hypothetical protein